MSRNVSVLHENMLFGPAMASDEDDTVWQNTRTHTRCVSLWKTIWYAKNIFMPVIVTDVWNVGVTEWLAQYAHARHGF